MQASFLLDPGPEAMRIMGSKLAAKECVKKYNIPMVPGIDKAIEDIKMAKEIADKIGYPSSDKSICRRRRKRNADRGKRNRPGRTNAKSHQRSQIFFW